LQIIVYYSKSRSDGAIWRLKLRPKFEKYRKNSRRWCEKLAGLP